MRKTLLVNIVVIALVASAAAHAQDVHVRVSPGAVATRDVYPTIQMALDHAPEAGPADRLYIHIAPGTYHERVFVTANRPRTTLLGMGTKPEEVVISASQNAQSAGGTFFSSTVEVTAPGFEADSLTFENAAGNTGQAVAITVRSDRAVFKRCRFLGDQDTLFADFGRQYYVDSYIQGGVDFIFGNATAVFDRSEVHIVRPGFLTAQSRVSTDQTTGYVFRHVRVTVDDLHGKSFYLGRPWRPFSRVVFISSDLPDSLSPQGWSPWKPADSIQTAFYAEYDSTGPGARPFARIAGSHQLTAEEATLFDPERFLSGTDHWDPLSEATKLP